jgi:hypothetical protein
MTMPIKINQTTIEIVNRLELIRFVLMPSKVYRAFEAAMGKIEGV